MNERMRVGHTHRITGVERPRPPDGDKPFSRAIWFLANEKAQCMVDHIVSKARLEMTGYR